MQLLSGSKEGMEMALMVLDNTGGVEPFSQNEIYKKAVPFLKRVILKQIMPHIRRIKYPLFHTAGL